MYYRMGCPNCFRLAVQLVSPAFDIVGPIEDDHVLRAQNPLYGCIDGSACVFLRSIIGSLMCVFRLEIIDGPLDREGMIGDQMHSEISVWGGSFKRGDFLLEEGEKLFCAVSFARCGITA